MTELYQHLFPQQYLSKLLSHDIRADYRNLTQYRPILIESNPLPQSPISSKVSIGDTVVLCSLSYELGLPSIFKQQQGQLHLKVSLPSTAGAHVQKLHPRERDVEVATIQQTLADFILQQQWVDLTHLYITDKCVWNIYADVTIVNHNGNLFDACLIVLQHAFELSEQRYNINTPYLPITILNQLRAQEKRRIEEEKSQQGDDYRPSAFSHQVRTTGFSEATIPKLPCNPARVTSILPLAHQIGIIDQRLIDSFQQTHTTDDHDTTTTWKSTLNALAIEDFPTLLYPPIIIIKKLYPTQLAIISTQSIEYTEPEDKSALTQEELVTFYKANKPTITHQKVLVLDPTYAETTTSSSILQILFDNQGKICFYQKTAGEPISPTELMRCLQLGARHSGRIAHIISQKISQHEEPSNNARKDENIFH